MGMGAEVIQLNEEMLKRVFIEQDFSLDNTPRTHL
jgi:hypothetical protein